MVRKHAATMKIAQIVVMFMVMFSMVVCADSGDGTGGGQGEALALLSTSVVDGAIDVPLDVQIVLGFSKNVIAISVREQNSQCFTLSKAQSDPIDLEVIMADDQLEPEKKREIILKPTQVLEPGAVYQLTISKTVTSKSGTNLEQDIQLSFTTIKTGAAASSINPVATAPVVSTTEVAAVENQTTASTEVSTTTMATPEVTTQVAIGEAGSESAVPQSEAVTETTVAGQLPMLMGLILAMIALAGLVAGMVVMNKRSGNGKAGRP